MKNAILRGAPRPIVASVLVAGMLLGAAGRAPAGPLNPLDFASLGAFPTAPGAYTINTSGTPTLTEPNGTIITGVVSNGVAVFDFDSIDVPSGQVISGTGSLPAALLSRNGITVSGEIDFSAYYYRNPYVPGPGGGGGPGGIGNGGAGGSAFFREPYFYYSLYGGGGGGGFGGTGGAGGSVMSPPGTGIPPLLAAGGAGGGTYGNLWSQLQGGGNGGGTAGTTVDGFGGPGGGGGGAIELGAIGNVSISGSILANGADLSQGPVGPGGGSGGGIFLHGEGVTLTGLLSADGGSASPGGTFYPGPDAAVTVAGGGGGGGGQVLIAYGNGGFTDTYGTIDVSGGAAAAPARFSPFSPFPSRQAGSCSVPAVSSSWATVIGAMAGRQLPESADPSLTTAGCRVLFHPCSGFPTAV